MDGSGYDLDQGRFSGAVFPEECVHFALFERDRKIVERDDAGIGLGDVIESQDCFAHCGYLI